MNSGFISTRTLKSTLLAGVVLLTGSAFAVNKGSVELFHPTNVAGTQLPAGTYNVQWDGSGDQVQLSILKGKKTVASTNARIVQVQTAPESDSAIVNKNGDGSMTLTQILLHGKKYALEITSGGGGAAGAAGSGR